MAATAPGNSYRWLQAVLALVVMIMISPYEYTFTLFEGPIAKAHGWSLPSVALTYTIYIFVASLFMIPSGRWSDRWQPRWFTTVAGLITGLGWIVSAHVTSLPELYICYAIGSLGPGYIYCNCVNNALKWFPEANRRGLAVGLIDMGFGMGSAIFIPLLSGIIASGPFGYQTAFQNMGVTMLVVIVVLAQFLRYPDRDWLPAGFDEAGERRRGAATGRGVANAARELSAAETLRTWQYWVALVGLALIASSGLMITAHIVQIAQTNVAIAAGAVGVAAATLSRIPNGVMRWVAGAISDYTGRELAMFVSFCICGVSLILMAHTHSGLWFIVLAMVAMGTWGPLFSLYPALISDYWGRENSGVIYGLVYGPGKAAGGIFAGIIAAAVFASTHSWVTDFHLAGAFAILAGLSALVLRRPAASTATRTAGRPAAG